MLSILTLLRPTQWLKNLTLLFPLFLGGELLHDGVWPSAILPLAVFCLASSSVYIYNDICDREQDRIHPHKASRPIASGRVPVLYAAILCASLGFAAFLLSVNLPRAFQGWLAAYLCLSFAYSTYLKKQPVFDIFCIALGFVFRLFAGGAAFGVEVSDWLFLSVLLLSLFLSAGKRLGEKTLLGKTSEMHRQALATYPEGSLDGFMLISGAAALVTYTMYAITMHKLVFTVPLCCFGLFRYLLLVKVGASGDPTDSLLKDPVMFAVAICWALMVGLATY